LEQGASDDKIDIIYNAVDIDEVEALKPKTRPLKFRYILVPRQLFPKNGVEYAVRAAALMKAKDVTILIAGDGMLRLQLEGLARTLGISDRVSFLGYVPRQRILPLMWYAEAVVVPSIRVAGFAEATSIAVLEAMAARCPVVASDVGGLRELIDDGRTGFRVPERDPEALAHAMDSIVLGSADVKTIGAAALEHVRQFHSLPGWIARIEAVYRKAISEH
jgi:glycosyltransferase involved in cell wall biosynthesis